MVMYRMLLCLKNRHANDVTVKLRSCSRIFDLNVLCTPVHNTCVCTTLTSIITFSSGTIFLDIMEQPKTQGNKTR